ncbi:hypothetical protein SLEP1_g56616 [Rubroshorea leprosula]|uniref:Disease resistance protein RGA3 n=1 Tax=Rubroshorea leprosula TaxID=152421 RepID=A0AAV5MK54_9ROSI|nr:hypothetical protein SLEP1_g56616 [Rubroshorea leprosula]
MGDSILGSIVAAAVSKVTAVASDLVTAFASDQVNLALGWEEELKKFHRTMMRLRGFLQDAHEKNVSGHLALKSWLQDLRDIADEADDILEEVAYEGMQREVKKSKVRRLTLPDPSPLLFRQEMANRVADLNKRLADINSSAHQLGLQYKLADMVPEPRGRAGRETHSFLSSQVFGREEDVSKMVSLLVDSSSQHDLPVMIIVGMAGLGKTTIAKAVLKNEKIREHFGDNKMWVCVSENFDDKKILMEMLKSCSGSSSGDGDFGSKDIVMKELQEKLGKKNYLLILDDVWNEERQMWEELRDCLLGISENKGSKSKVLVTTRLENVASLMALTDEHIHRPCLLKDDECWSIIKQRAFGNNSVPEAVEGIGIQIARRCKGVPLAARIIGCMRLNEWQAIIENSVWDSPEKEKGILDIIKFSYDRLPTLALKQCFAFCSIFPKDFVMEREMLIQLWMAQGFLESSEESYMAAEDIGDKYFRYLLSYSLFQEERRDNVTGSVKSCKMHDLIHDFARSISKFETLIVEKWLGSNISHDVRHLNLIDGREMVPTILEDVAKKLQTLFSKHVFSSGVQVDLKRLRVLSLDDASDAKQLPTCFGNSKRLRYLDISRTQMKELPEFISELYNLQTFRFTNCKSLKMPPGGIGDLINLRHIYFNDEERMPANLGRLTNLQTLPLFFVSTTKGRKIEELGSLRGLKGGLEIRKLDLVEGKSEAEKAKLHEKAVDVEDCDGLEYLPSGLSSCPALEELEIWQCSNLVSIPEEVKQLRSLVKLVIWKCPKFVPSLEGFVSLKTVMLNDCDGLEYLSSGLSSCIALEELKILKCSNLVSIPEELKQLRSLVKLEIWKCPKLKFVPSLEGLVSLKTVVVEDCDGLECLPSGLSSCTALEKLKIWNCCNLVSIPEELKQLRSLVELHIFECRKLRSFPEELSLERLRYENCPNRVSFHGELKELHSLTILGCPKLVGLLKESLGCCTRLKTLDIGRFSEELEEFPSLSSIPASLEDLTLMGWEKLTQLPQIQHLTALKMLTICNFSGMESLPDWFNNLSSLQRLDIWKCSNKLRERCTKGSGPDWHKISHIPCIAIDGEFIQSKLRQRDVVNYE